MNKEFQRIPVQVPAVLAARLTRIAQKRFATSYRKLPTLGAQAIAEYTEREEKALKLEPITPEEVEELSAGKKEAVAA